MSEILELEEQAAVVVNDDAPKLLVPWSSRWEEFVGSIRPALSRSQARLAGEAPFGLIPFRIMIPSYVVEAFLIVSAVFVQVKIDELRPRVVPVAASYHDVIYYSGDELPRTEDLGGAEAGRSGVAGGEEAYHRTQTIRVARGGSLTPKVVDAPNVKLPSSRDAVANLLAIRPDPGPPPAEGLRSTRTVPRLTAALIAPAPSEIRDYTRNGIHLDPVIGPAPSLMHRPVTAPSLSTAPVAPAPDVSSNHTLVAPALAPSVIAPAPTVSQDHPLVAPRLDPAVAPPAQNVRDPFRAAPSLSANVVAPAPTAVARQLSSAPLQTMDPAVVPPPVSAPERANARNAKMTLPSPAVVAPPPSTDVSADMRRLSPGGVPDPSKAVVPPPPSPSAGGSFMSSLLGRIFGPTELVTPPPPSVSAKGAGSGARPMLADNVAPPPPAVNAAELGGNARGNRKGVGTNLGSNVVAPPPSVGVSGGTGTSDRAAARYVGNPTVVAPPPTLGGPGGGTGNIGGAAGATGGRMLAENVVPPPPSVNGASSGTGSGLGRKGVGLGAPLDAGAELTSPKNGGSGKDSGTVMSSQPGTKIGVPPNESKGLLALSPAGADKPGLGGGGGGTSILHGSGHGSGMNADGGGAAKSSSGHGSDPSTHGGISPANGPGGAGSVPSGNPPVPGVGISGGSTGIVTLPSFGPDSSGKDPATPGRSSLKQDQRTFAVDIVGGGPFEAYKKLLSGETHTTYVDTIIGNVPMYYATESQAPRGFQAALTPPAALRADLPDGLPHARMVVACTLDASGNIRNPRVLEPGPAHMTAKVLAALQSWKFQPAMRNNQPVEVTAILGFNIDTNDRF